MERIQVLLDPAEKEQVRRLAQGRGLSLSAWLREAALSRAAEESQASRLRSLDALRGFFAECDAREAGSEPEWSEHLEVLGASKRDGAGELPCVVTGETAGDEARRPESKPGSGSKSGLLSPPTRGRR